jgi:hypothetical protein
VDHFEYCRLVNSNFLTELVAVPKKLSRNYGVVLTKHEAELNNSIKNQFLPQKNALYYKAQLLSAVYRTNRSLF